MRRANAGRKLLSRGVREELEVERSPLRVSDHRLERVPGGELGLLGRAFDVISAGREHLADVASAFGAAAVQELQEQLLHWAVPLGDAIARANGYRIGDGFISPLDLVEIGLMSAEEAKELHAMETARSAATR